MQYDIQHQLRHDGQTSDWWSDQSVVISDIDPAAENQLISVEAARVSNSDRHIYIAAAVGYYEKNGNFWFKDEKHRLRNRDGDVQPRINGIDGGWWMPRNGTRDPLFIGVHEACLQLVREVILAGNQGRENVFLTTIGDLWNILRLRVEGEHYVDLGRHHASRLKGDYTPGGVQTYDWNLPDKHDVLHSKAPHQRH